MLLITGLTVVTAAVITLFLIFFRVKVGYLAENVTLLCCAIVLQKRIGENRSSVRFSVPFVLPLCLRLFSLSLTRAVAVCV